MPTGVGWWLMPNIWQSPAERRRAHHRQRLAPLPSDRYFFPAAKNVVQHAICGYMYTINYKPAGNDNVLYNRQCSD
jgi:hypothetical protein